MIALWLLAGLDGGSYVAAAIGTACTLSVMVMTMKANTLPVMIRAMGVTNTITFKVSMAIRSHIILLSLLTSCFFFSSRRVWFRARSHLVHQTHILPQRSHTHCQVPLRTTRTYSPFPLAAAIGSLVALLDHLPLKLLPPAPFSGGS